jgi:hypothetical protein
MIVNTKNNKISQIKQCIKIKILIAKKIIDLLV